MVSEDYIKDNNNNSNNYIHNIHKIKIKIKKINIYFL